MSRRFPPAAVAPCLGAVAVSLHADTLIVEPIDTTGTSSVDLELRVENQSSVVGVQFDVVYPISQVSPVSALPASSSDHQVASRDLGGRQRVVVHSPTNMPLPNEVVVDIPLHLNGTTPEGGPSLVIENVVFTDAAGHFISSIVAYHPMEVWRQTRFTEQERSNPEIVSDTADPDGDGIWNIFEYLYGSDPTQADSDQLHRVGFRPESLENPEPVAIIFEYPLAIASSGGAVTLQSSSDLLHWQTEVAPPEVAHGDLFTYQVRQEVPLQDGEPRRFFRLAARRDITASPVPGHIDPLPFDDWRGRHFSVAELAASATSGAQADPDGDNISNLLEYLLGSSPRLPNQVVLPLPGITAGPTGSVETLTFRRSKEAENVRLIIQRSPDLKNWAEVSYAEENTGRETGLGIERRAVLEYSATDKAFFRFRAESTAP